MSGVETEQDWIKKIRWLIFARLAIATFLLSVAFLIEYLNPVLADGASAARVFYFLAAPYLFSILYIMVLNQYSGGPANIRIQAAGDAILVTVLVYITGGIASYYSAIYPLIVIYAVLFLSWKGGVAVATWSGFLYGTLLVLDLNGIITPAGAPERQPGAAEVYIKIIVQFFSLYVIAFLTSFVAEQEKKLRALLAAKESAFDQLDLLHRSIIESIDAGILTLDPSGRIKSFNRAACDITGYSSAEVLNRHIGQIFPEFQYSSQIGAGRPPYPGGRRRELPVTGKSGKIILGFSVSPLVDGRSEKIGEILIFQDVTTVREMEKQVERNRRLALIGEMAAGLAHEMRNPLAAIGGSIRLLSREGAGSGTGERLMRIILRGKEQLEAFLRDFLLLSKPAHEAPEPVQINEMIEDVLESIRFGPDWTEDVEVVKKMNGELVVFGNRSELQQVFLNVILNSFQAMNSAGRLTIDTGIEGAQAMIRIEDTGPGIEKENMDRIFEPFYTTKERGTGLGLAIVSRIVESHAGRVTIESEPGRGTRCTIRIPAYELSEGTGLKAGG